MAGMEFNFQELTRHQHLALFINNLCANSFQSLNKIDSTLPSLEFEGQNIQQLSSLEILIRRFLANKYFQDKLSSIWFFIKEETMDQDDINRAVQDFIQGMHLAQNQTNKIPMAPLIHLSDSAAIRDLCVNHQVDDILLVDSLAPLLDLAIAEEMHSNHIKYFAEYTFSEDVPTGFSGQLAHRSILNRFGDKDSRSQYTLDEIVRKNINTFDIEVHFQDPDIRIYRVDGTLANPLQARFTSGILNLAQKIPNYAEFAQIVLKKPEIQRPHPTYIELELVGQCQLNCIFCPRHYESINRSPMKPDLFQRILKELTKEGFPLTICLGGMGEPLIHPDFPAIMELLFKEKLVSQIILETNGIELNPKMMEKLLTYQDKLFIIVNINALDAESYIEIHGKDHFAGILENLENINKELIIKKEFITVQFLKINQTQKIIDKFYSYWNDRKLNVLLQKQNTYNGLVKDFRFSDLTPLERFPCWHLKRDLVIWADGSVTVCKQDIQGKKILGNFQALGLNEIWENGKNIAIQEATREFPEYPVCAKCDEWYTFNF